MSYIGRLFEIHPSVLSQKIKKEWKFPDPEPKRRMKPSTEKFLKKNKQIIKTRLDSDITVKEIAKELGCNEQTLRYSMIPNDPILYKAWQDQLYRTKKKTEARLQKCVDNSKFDYDFEDLPGEIWKEVLGYPKYQVSNYGRIKSFAKKYGQFYLIHPYLNRHTGRYLVALCNDGEVKMMNFARVVAHTFCEGFSEKKNTVNHKDGNPRNNRADNLEWVSQSENNLHAYRVLGKKAGMGKKWFSKVIYDNKYEFKTIGALAKFLGKSPTQTRRYLEEPEKHNLKIIP